MNLDIDLNKQISVMTQKEFLVMIEKALDKSIMNRKESDSSSSTNGSNYTGMSLFDRLNLL